MILCYKGVPRCGRNGARVNKILCRRLSAASIFALVAGTCALTAARAAEPKPTNAALMRPVAQLVAAINRTTTAYPAAAFTSDCSAADEFSPFAWNGASGCRAWYADLTGARDPAIRREYLATHVFVTVGTPRFVQASRGRAYFVLPSSFTFYYKGKHLRQTGDWVIVEERVGSVWKISSHSWAITADNLPA